MVMTAVVLGGSRLGLLAESIGQNTPVDLCIVGAAVTASFYVGMMLQGLRDGQKATDKRLSRIEKKMGISEETEEG